MDAIDKARKSLASTEDTVEKSAEVEKTDPDVKAQEEATKSTEEAEKNVNQATISDDNEKVTKDVDDDDDVEESADKKDKATKSVDEAEKSEDEPAVEKNTDAKTEEAKAKQHKELTNVDDPKGHEEASKSFDTKAVIDALTKSVDTMAEMQKSYKELAEASMEIAKSFLAKQAPIEDQAEKSVEKSQTEKCGDGADVEESADKKDKTAKSADDDQEPDTDDEAKDDKEDKAKKSVEEPADNADEAEKSVEEPAEEDKAEKSIPTGKAVATGAEEAKDDTVAKSVEAPQEDGVTKEALENVIAKSLLGFDGVQSGINLERKQALKSLLADTRGLKGTTVPDSFIERYNEI
jgi:hypothetical protein